MKLLRLLIIAALLLSFTSGIAIAQDNAAPLKSEKATPEERKSEKRTPEERKAQKDKRQAKRAEELKKRVEHILDMLKKIETAMAENKMGEQFKTKTLENLKNRLEVSDVIISETKEDIKFFEEQLKVSEETKAKINEVYNKLSSYTPPAKQAPPAAEKK